MKRYTFGCCGKISYATQKLASLAKRAMLRKDHHTRDVVSVFACQQCSGYHIGRQRRTGYGSGTADHRKDSFKSLRARYIELTEQDA